MEVIRPAPIPPSPPLFMRVVTPLAPVVPSPAMSAPPAAPDAASARRYQALLAVSDALVRHHDLNALFADLEVRLKTVVHFDFINFVLHDPARDVMRLNILGRDEQQRLNLPLEMPVDEAMSGWVWIHQKPLVIPELAEEKAFPRLVDLFLSHGIHSACVLPLTTSQRRLGALAFASRRPAAYNDEDLQFLTRVAEQVALAVDGALGHQAAASYQQDLTRERDRLRLLLELNNVLVSSLETQELFRAISQALGRVVQHDYASITIQERDTGRLRLHALAFSGGKGLVHPELEFHTEGSPHGIVLTSRRPLLLDRLDPEKFPSEIIRLMLREGIKSAVWLPLLTRNGVLGTLAVGSLRENAFQPLDVDLLLQVAGQVAIAVENALAFSQIAELKDKLAEEKLYLEDEIRTQYNFEEIVGQSAAMRRILQQVETVAPTDATVLITGDSGTGKELIARAIHNLSPRRDRTFVKLNCAAIPTGLLESELFGHEKGAFTGALAQRIGRFELADTGTLLLDEVGDIPLELQPKLLRALQEMEFERLGSTRTIKVNVRILAATNHNLLDMVEQRRFRSDLYYRLNVFPLHVPPLREHAEDIPDLARYFAQKYAARMNRPIRSIPAPVMDAILRWHWPGNVRELENFIERAVILSRGSVLEAPLSELKVARAPAVAADPASTLEDAEREHILKVLRETRGVVAGPEGAAARLGLKRTTLNSKMKKLGITKSDWQ